MIFQRTPTKKEKEKEKRKKYRILMESNPGPLERFF